MNNQNNNEIIVADQAFSNFKDYQAHVDYITKQQKLLDVRKNGLIKDFSSAISQGNVEKVKQLVSWGIEDFTELFDTNRQNQTVFNFNSPIPITQSSRRYTSAGVDDAMRQYLLMEAPAKIKKAALNCYTQNLDEQMFGPYNYQKYSLNHKTLNDLQWLMDNIPSKCKKYEEYLLKNWGNIPFDLEKHDKLHHLVMDHFKDKPEAVLNIFSELSNKKNTFNTANAKDYDFPSVEQLYELPFYQEVIDKLPRHIMMEYGKKNLEKAIGIGNKESINFWVSFYIPFPDSKQPYSQLVQSCHSHADFFDVLGFVLDNVDITLNNHFFLRAALPNNHKDTVSYLFTRYNKKQLLEVKDLFKEKKYQHYQNLYQDALDRMVVYNSLHEMPANDKQTFKHKI